MQTSIYICCTASPSGHCSVQNTHEDGVVSIRSGVGLDQTTWLIRQCLDCICFLFVSHRLHLRYSVVIKLQSERVMGRAPKQHYEMGTTEAE